MFSEQTLIINSSLMSDDTFQRKQIFSVWRRGVGSYTTLNRSLYSSLKHFWGCNPRLLNCMSPVYWVS
jgi:hypothetical protein